MSESALHVVCPYCGTVNRIPGTRSALEAKCGTCHQLLFIGKPLAADGNSFERHIVRNDIPVVVDFWASWCGPCLAMAPAYERAAAELEPRFRLLKVNADEEQKVAAKFGIRSIPTLMLFAKGRPVARSAGAMNTNDIVAWIQSHAPAD